MLLAKRAEWCRGVIRNHDPPESPLSMLYTQRGEWGFTTLHGPEGALNCHSEWVSSTWRTPRLWLYFVLTTRMLLVARNGQQMTQTIRHAAFIMRVASPRPLYAPLWLCPWISCMLISEALRPCCQTNHLELLTSWCSKTTSWNTCWHTWSPDQTMKTIAKFLYGGFISTFGAPARLLSDRGANFTSSVIEEMCKILGIKWLWTMLYHPKVNGLVEIAPEDYVHDPEAGRRQECWLAISFGWNSTCL